MFLRSIFAASLLITALLSGCGSVGNANLRQVNHGDLDSQLTRGRSTKTDVRQRLGDPQSVSFTDSGNELWNYSLLDYHTTATSFIPVVNWFSSGIEGTTKTVVIFFDKAGKVQNFAFNSAPLQAKHGIVKQ